MYKSREEAKFVIFTDLDGTLLDDNYSYEKALPMLKEIKKRKIPLIFCTAKTRAEQEYLRKKIGVFHPFIVENGSAIYIPKGYFETGNGKTKKYEVIILGVNAIEIRREIEKLKKKYEIKCYGDVNAKEVSKVTGLDLRSAKLAKEREYGETIIKAEGGALKSLKKKFNVVIGGRFVQVFGKGADKGKAVKILTKKYRKFFGKIITIGIGNAQNDEKMLKVVDIPSIVKNSDGKWVDLKIQNLYKAKGIGPEGWSEVVRRFVLKL